MQEKKIAEERRPEKDGGMPSIQPDKDDVTSEKTSGAGGESHLLERAKARDEHAFVELLKRYADIILSIIRRYVRNIVGYDEDDIVQEIHINAYKILPNFRGDDISFQVWLRRSTNGICLNLLEKQRRQETVSLETLCLEMLEHSLPNHFPDPDTALHHKEIRHTVQAAIARLPEKLGKVVSLKDLQGLGYEEIAVILGIGVGTVKSRLHRGRTLLRKELQAVR